MNSKGPTPYSPTASWLQKEAVSSLAEDVAQRLGYAPGDNVHETAEKLGGTISYRDIWAEDADDGSLVVEKIGKFEIFLPATTSLERDRFTIAHELGHYVLHYLLPHDSNSAPQHVRFTRYGSTRLEWEANWFAAAFLMPKENFLQQFKQCNGDLRQLADHYKVSTAAAEVRAKSLGLM